MSARTPETIRSRTGTQSAAAEERIRPAAVAARLDVAPPLARRRDELEDDLPREQDERPGDVVAVGEERPVAGVRLLLRLDAADREDHVVGLAREQVPAARAAVREQPDAGRPPPLDLGAVGRRRAGHHPLRLLLDPAEGGNVLVRAEQDPGLARSGLGGEVGLPLDEAVAVLADPAREVRARSRLHRALQDRQREPVDLEVDDPGHVGRDVLAGAARDPLRHAERVHVVVVDPDDDVEHERRRRRDDRREPGRPQRVDVDPRVLDARRDHQRGRVDDKDEQEVEEDREREPQRRDDRRQNRVDHGEDGGGCHRRAEPGDRDARDDPRREEQRRRCHEPGEQDAHGAEPRPLRRPLHGLGERSRCGCHAERSSFRALRAAASAAAFSLAPV